MSSISRGLQRPAVVALTALLVFVPATLRAQNGTPATVQAVTPTSQQVAISTSVQQPPGVVVRDASGNLLQGVTVSFIAATGAGTASPASVVSGSDGIARLTRWTVGSSAGTDTVFAKVTRLASVVFTATAVQPAPGTPLASAALRTTVPTGGGSRPTGMTIKTFTIANAAATTADRDVTFQLSFEGSSALYRIGEGAASTGPWLIASGGAASGPLQLISGPEGRRTLYLQIREDASSPVTTTRATSIQLKYPSQEVSAHGFDALDTARAAGFSSSAKKTSSSVGSILKPGTCTFRGASHMAAGDLALGPFSVGLSPETICEFKLLSGRKLKAGWTLQRATLDFFMARVNGSTCEMKSAAFGTDNPELTIVVRHPGSINPLDAATGTQCYLRDITFRGPDDPNIVEGITGALSASW